MQQEKLAATKAAPIRVPMLHRILRAGSMQPGIQLRTPLRSTKRTPCAVTESWIQAKTAISDRSMASIWTRATTRLGSSSCARAIARYGIAACTDGFVEHHLSEVASLSPGAQTRSARNDANFGACWLRFISTTGTRFRVRMVSNSLLRCSTGLIGADQTSALAICAGISTIAARSVERAGKTLIGVVAASFTAACVTPALSTGAVCYWGALLASRTC